MVSDGELLRCYADDGSEASFTAVVQRHINMVYRAALRRVGGNAHAADDVTQRVFTDLARKAGSLKGRSSVAGWLHTGTRFASAEAVRAERRRRVHEQEAQIMHELDSTSVSGAGLEPFLDEVLDLLSERDRNAVLLHYFEGRPFAEVGGILSLSADAARMRVSRSLERLRTGLARKGIASSAAALAAALSAQFALAVPAPMALSVAGHALSHARQAGGSSASGLSRIAASPIVRWFAVSTAIAVIGVSILAIKQPRHPTGAASIADLSDGTTSSSAFPSVIAATAPGLVPSASPTAPEPSADHRLLAIRRPFITGLAPGIVGEGLRIRINMIYGPLFQTLHLPPPALAQFRKLLLEAHEAPPGTPEIRTEPGYYARILAAQTQAVGPRIESFLGAANYAQYAQYEKNIEPWIIIDESPASQKTGPASN